MTDKLSDHLLNLKTNFMRTRNYLLIISLLLTLCQGCVKELHELPPRPGLVVKLNGIERDSIIVAPGEEITVDVEFIANQGIIQELYIKDNAGVYLPDFPLTMDSTELQNKNRYTYSFCANDYLPERGSHYQSYNFQVVCKDNNQPKQLINKTITILIADELKSYTVTLGAQGNTQYGNFLNISTGEVFTLEQVRQMNLEELLHIDVCYFYGEEDEVTSSYQEQHLYPIAGVQSYTASWLNLTNTFEAMASYKIPALEQINGITFAQHIINASPKYIDEYQYTTDLSSYGNPTSSNATNHPTWEGIYIMSMYRYLNWPSNTTEKEHKVAVYQVKEIVPGKKGYITLNIKAAPQYLY